MDSIDFIEFVKLIKLVAKENDEKLAINKLLRHGFIDLQMPCNHKYTNAYYSLTSSITDTYTEIINYDLNKRAKTINYLHKYFDKFCKTTLYSYLKIIDEEQIEIIKKKMEDYDKIINEKFSEKEIKIIFIDNILSGSPMKKTNYYKEKFKLTPITYLEIEAYTKLIDMYFEKFKLSCDFNKKIELLDEKYENRLKEVILFKQKKYSDEEIIRDLKVQKNFYKNMLIELGIKRVRHSIKTESVINNQEPIYININEEKINDTIKTIIDEAEKEQFNENDAEFYEGISSKEGKRKLCIHIKIERNPKIAKMAKEYFKLKHNGRLYCQACGFDFYETYGDLGKDYIEAHHVEVLSENGEVITTVKCFIMVCSCCHKMLHRKYPCLTLEELREILMEQRKLNNVQI